MENQEKKKPYVAYEYKEIVANKERAGFLLDSYENFGWEINERLTEGVTSGADSFQKSVVILHLKRNRKIVNKMELTRLQRNFEACVREIDLLERSKSSKATMYALLIGIMGTVFMASSVFAVTAPVPNIPLCIILAIPALAGWILPYFVFRKIIGENTEKANELIERKYDEICEICEKGHRLIH